VSLSGRIHSWAVGGSTDGETPERLCVFDELYALLQPLDHVVRDEVLSQLRNQIKRGSGGHTACRPMTGEEVCKLDEGGLVRVGAHTVTHPVLSAHPPEIQLREIRDSKEALERMLGRPVTSLSYPFGGAAAVGPVAPRLAQQMGFDVACSTMHRCVRRGADRYGLPRFAIRNWDGDEFARRLRGFRAGQ
jgi:hypothetical protein